MTQERPSNKKKDREVRNKGFSLESLADMSVNYMAALRTYFGEKGILLEFYRRNTTIDHLAVKLRDAGEYDRWREQIASSEDCAWATEVVMDERRMATVALREPMFFGPYGGTTILEMMEPKPGSSGDSGKLDHIELGFPLAEVRSILKRKGVVFTDYENPDHKAVVLKGDNGFELKFTDSRLEKIAKKSVEEKRAVWIKRFEA